MSQELKKKKSNDQLIEMYVRDNQVDSDVFESVINQHEYGFIRFKKDPEVIIDIGANIGTASIYFANLYPKARIIAVEPAPDNYEVLRMNTEKYPMIQTLKCAILKKGGNGRILTSKDNNPLEYHVTTDDGGELVCKSLADIMNEFSIPNVDLLKIDVEGSEKEIFEDSDLWIGKVGTIIVELHERLVKGCNLTVFSKIDKLFDIQWIGGENFYFSNEGLSWPAIPSIYKSENPASLPIEMYWIYRNKYNMVHSEISRQMDQELNNKDCMIELLAGDRDQKDELISKLEFEIEQKDLELEKRENVIREVSEERNFKDKLISLYIGIIEQKDLELKDRENVIEKVSEERNRKDELIAQLIETIEQKDQELNNREDLIRTVCEERNHRDELIAQLSGIIEQKDQELKKREDVIHVVSEDRNNKDELLVRLTNSNRQNTIND